MKHILIMLSKSNADEINDFRSILLSVYRNANKGDYCDEDKNSMINLKEQLVEKLKRKNTWDKIQILQIDYLISNLDMFICNCF